MKVLVVTSGINPASGGPTRSCKGMCRALAQAGVDVTLLVLHGHDPFENPCGVKVIYAADPLPPNLYSLIHTFDLVHIQALWVWRLHKVAKACRKAKVPYVISPRGMLDPWALSVKKWKKRLGMFLYQRGDLKHAVAFHATAELEASNIRAQGLKQPIFVAPNGVEVPEGDGKKVGGESRWTKDDAHSGSCDSRVEMEKGRMGDGKCSREKRLNSEEQRRRAEEKVEEWLAGVDETTFAAALEKLVAEKTAAGEYRFKKGEERELAIAGAKRFFVEFSRKIVPLSDGRCVYFAPDVRAKTRNGSKAVSWAEYAFHAVSNGGVKLTGKDYHERWYNPRKIPAFASIVSALTTEHCFVRLSGTVKQDAIVFAGAGYAGESVQVVTRLDETGNMDANLSEVTFTSTSKGQKKLPRLVPLTEAVRTVVHHQTTAGSYPLDKGIVANSSEAGKGGGEKCLNVGIGECLNIDGQFHSPTPTRNSNSGDRVAIFLSRLHPGKGLLTLAEAWARVKPQGWVMRVVGPDSYGHKTEVLAKLDSLGIPHFDVHARTAGERPRSEVKVKSGIDNVHCQPQPSTSTSFHWEFVDMVDDKTKWAEYATADVLIHPSVSENFGITIAEALYAGLPVICTKGTPWKDVEGVGSRGQGVGGEGCCGMWIDQGVDALAAALSELLNLSTSELRALGMSGRALIERKYLWPAIGKALKISYEEVLDGLCRDFLI